MSSDSDGDTAESSGPTITFGPSTAKTVLSELGFQVGDGDIVVDETETPVEPAFGEAPITVDEVAGFVTDDNGTVSVIRDDFTSLVEYVKQFDAGSAEHSDSYPGDMHVEHLDDDFLDPTDRDVDVKGWDTDDHDPTTDRDVDVKGWDTDD